MQKFRKFLFQSVDIAPLVYFRIAFGALMLWEVLRYFYMDRIERYYITPKFFFSYLWFDWIQPLPGDGMYLLFAALGILSVGIICGYYYRLCAALFFLGFTYVFLLDQTNYLNHFYLISLVSFLMIFVPAHRAFSLDVTRNPKLNTEKVPYWSKFLLQFQVAVVYIYGGIAKINYDWLHGEPMRMWLARRTDFPVIGQYFDEEWMVYFFSYSGLLLDLLFIPLILWKRTRIIGFILVISFHLLNSQLFYIGIFPWFMIAATAILFINKWPKFWSHLPYFQKLHFSKRAGIPKPKMQYLLTMVIGAYMLIQLLAPFRHHLYPGEVSWTEEGHKFSWRMKLRSKIARARFFVYDPRTNISKEFSPSFFLNPKQTMKMSPNPAMLIQFAKLIKRELRKQNVRGIEVRCLTYASLNNRDYQLLVDSTFDLAAEPWDIWHDDWIEPLHEPLRLPESN